MTRLLLHLFVKKPHDPARPEFRSRVGALSGAVGIGANAVLFLAKLTVGLLTGSVSVTADAMNNLTDATSSVVTLVGFRLSAKPADRDHPYGHARYEYLTGLAVAALILLIGFELARTSLERILRPVEVSFSALAVAVLVCSIGVKLWLWRFNRRLARTIRSSALEATAADSRNDCLATAAVLAALVLERRFHLRVDGIMGLGVAVFILLSGWSQAKKTVSPLLGQGASPELAERIVDYISANEKVLGYHDLMVHDYGPGRRFATLHVEMDYREDPLLCHELIDDMERECMDSHGVHLVIHYDPIITDDPELTRLHSLADRLLRDADPRLRSHDFRMVRRQDRTDLIFDVTVPEDLAREQESLRRALEETISRSEGRPFRLRITFDPAGYAPQSEK